MGLIECFWEPLEVVVMGVERAVRDAYARCALAPDCQLVTAGAIALDLTFFLFKCMQGQR